MRTFRWLSTDDIPPGIDLRRCGWTLVEDCAAPARIGLAEYHRVRGADWLMLLNPPAPWLRRSIVLAGVDDSDERARLVRLGFGEVLGPALSIAEMEARAARVAEQSTWLPDRRVVGPLVLDMRARDGRVGQRALGLHPREFALLWRLAERPGAAVSKRALLADIWNLSFVPETNSLAVHVFRLRTKLAQAGLGQMVCTEPGGGYALVAAGEPAASPAPIRGMIEAEDRDDRHDD